MATPKIGSKADPKADILREISRLEDIRDRVITFENDNLEVISEYLALHNEMVEVESSLKTRMASMPLQSGQKVEFKKGWTVQLNPTRRVNTAVVLQKAPSFLQRHPELVSITLKAMDNALKDPNSGITAEIYNEAIYEEPGAVKTAIPKFKA